MVGDGIWLLYLHDLCLHAAWGLSSKDTALCYWHKEARSGAQFRLALAISGILKLSPECGM